MRTIRIDVIKRRLQAECGVSFGMQDGDVIRYVQDDDCVHESQMHYSTGSVDAAAAGEAYRVLRDGERLAARYEEVAS